MELLQVSQARLDDLLKQLNGVDLFLKKMEMEEEEFVPVGLEMGLEEARMVDEKESKAPFTLTHFCRT